MKKFRWALATVLLLPFVAPVSGFAQGDASRVGEKKIKRNPNVLTREEISTLPEVGDAYEAIQRLRPRFLQLRGINRLVSSAPPEPIVYLDEVKRGQIDFLRSVPVHNIGEIRYLRGVDATTRWGMGHEAGAIMIYTLKSNNPQEGKP